MDETEEILRQQRFKHLQNQQELIRWNIGLFLMLYTNLAIIVPVFTLFFIVFTSHALEHALCTLTVSVQLGPLQLNIYTLKHIVVKGGRSLLMVLCIASP